MLSFPYCQGLIYTEGTVENWWKAGFSFQNVQTFMRGHFLLWIKWKVRVHSFLRTWKLSKRKTVKDSDLLDMDYTEKCTTWLTVILMYVAPFLSLLWQDVVSQRTKLTHRGALSLKKYKLALIIAGKRAECVVQTAILFSELIFLQTAQLHLRVSWIGRRGYNFSNLEGQNDFQARYLKV